MIHRPYYGRWWVAWCDVIFILFSSHSTFIDNNNNNSYSQWHIEIDGFHSIPFINSFIVNLTDIFILLYFCAHTITLGCELWMLEGSIKNHKLISLSASYLSFFLKNCLLLWLNIYLWPLEIIFKQNFEEDEKIFKLTFNLNPFIIDTVRRKVIRLIVFCWTFCVCQVYN
jgi:hypothetical protein